LLSKSRNEFVGWAGNVIGRKIALGEFKLTRRLLEDPTSDMI